MAATIAVTLNTSTYTALSSTETAEIVYVGRGQSVRLHIGATAPAAGTADFIPFDGPTTSDDMVRPVDLRLLGMGAGDEAYALLIHGPTGLSVARGSGSSTPTTTTESGVTLTDISIASATGASQPIAPADETRQVLAIVNPGTTTWWVNGTGGVAAPNAAGSAEVPAGGSWTPRRAPTNVVTGIGTASSKLTVWRG